MLTRCAAALIPSAPPEPSRAFAEPSPEPPHVRGSGAELLLARNPFESAPLGDRVPSCAGFRVSILAESSDPSWSLAAIGRGAVPTRLVRAGERVDEMRVLAVGARSVWLSGANGSCRVDLGAEPSPSDVERPEERRVVVPRALLESLIADPSRLLRGARIGADRRLEKVAPGSTLARLGARAGDRLLAVDGLDLDRPSDALRAWVRLGRADRIVLQIEREGRPAEFEVLIE